MEGISFDATPNRSADEKLGSALERGIVFAPSLYRWLSQTQPREHSTDRQPRGQNGPLHRAAVEKWATDGHYLCWAQLVWGALSGLQTTAAARTDTQCIIHDAGISRKSQLRWLVSGHGPRRA